MDRGHHLLAGAASRAQTDHVAVLRRWNRWLACAACASLLSLAGCGSDSPGPLTIDARSNPSSVPADDLGREHTAVARDSRTQLQSGDGFPVNTEPPVYGEEYVRPPEEVITNPADDPAFRFQQQTHRWPVIDQSGTQVGYIDSVDLYSRQGDEPLDVKDAKANKVGTMDRQGYHPLGTP